MWRPLSLRGDGRSGGSLSRAMSVPWILVSPLDISVGEDGEGELQFLFILS